jgi:hypothetical protein
MKTLNFFLIPLYARKFCFGGPSKIPFKSFMYQVLGQLLLTSILFVPKTRKMKIFKTFFKYKPNSVVKNLYSEFRGLPEEGFNRTLDPGLLLRRMAVRVTRLISSD